MSSTLVCITSLLSFGIISTSSLSTSDVTEVTSSSGKFIGVYLNSGNNEITTSEARSYCQTNHYDLATILSDDENTEAVSAVQSAGLSGNHNIWIGYTDSSDFVDTTTEGTFSWMDGSTSDYTKWYTGEPNDAYSNEDCTVIYTGWSNHWNDFPCTSETNAFVCLSQATPTLPRDDVTSSTSSSNKFIGVVSNNGAVTTSVAREFCQYYYYDLATILSDDENTEAVTAVQDAGLSGHNNIWIGYTDSSDFVDSSVEGTFSWMDGSSSEYTKWYSGEPNDAYSNEDCTVIYTGWSNHWNDYPCTNTANAFVCLSHATPTLSRDEVSSSVSSSDKFVGVVPNGGVTAYVAREFCQYYYHDLATLQSDSQGNEIITTVRNAGGFSDSYNFDVWIGFTDDSNNFDGVSTSEGTFVWADGSINSYSNWYTNEPNDAGGNEDCTVIVTVWGNQWNDAICTATPVAFACETEVATNSPTGQPTGSPTNKPTNSPSSDPTESPTDKPTGTPTREPTLAPTTMDAGWNTYPNLHIDPGCTADEYVSSNLGATPTADDCFIAAYDLYPTINYIVWRGDVDNGCHTCDISDRSEYNYYQLSGATSFTFFEATLTYDQVTESTSSSGKFTGVYLNAGDNTVTAEMAREYCEAHFYDLATITSDDENTEAITAAQNAGLTGSQDIWIGYTDAEYFGASGEGTFIWMDGDDSTYTNWGPNEPNDAYSNEDCTVIWTGYNAWNDLNCDWGRNAFVCLNEQTQMDIEQVSQSNWNLLNQYLNLDDKTYVMVGVAMVLSVFGIIGLIRKLRLVSNHDYKNIDYQKIENSSGSQQRYNYHTINM